MENKRQIVLPSGAGKKYQFAGVEVVMKAFKSETDTQWSLMEYKAPARFKGPGLHYHKIMEEGFYVLDGTVTFKLDGETIEAPAGSFVKVPPMAVHTFRNDTDQPIRFLVFMSPGGFENYFDDLQVLMEQEERWPPKGMGKIAQLLTKYDTYPPEG